MSFTHQVGQSASLGPHPFDLSLVPLLIEQAVTMVVVDFVLGVFQARESGLIAFQITLPRLSDAAMGFVKGVGYIGRKIVRYRYKVHGVPEIVEHGILFHINEFIVGFAPVRATIVIVLNRFSAGLEPLYLGIVGHLGAANAFDPVRE